MMPATKITKEAKKSKGTKVPKGKTKSIQRPAPVKRGNR